MSDTEIENARKAVLRAHKFLAFTAAVMAASCLWQIPKLSLMLLSIAIGIGCFAILYMGWQKRNSFCVSWPMYLIMTSTFFVMTSMNLGGKSGQQMINAIISVLQFSFLSVCIIVLLMVIYRSRILAVLDRDFSTIR